MSDIDNQRVSPNGLVGSAVERLVGQEVVLLPVGDSHLPDLIRIRSTPEVVARWRGAEDIEAELRYDLDDDEVEQYVVSVDSTRGSGAPYDQSAVRSNSGSRESLVTIGLVQWSAEEDADYLHASIDIYLDPAYHGRGFGTDAVATLARHLFSERGHHRITIDPAADNHVAIRSYAKVGFKPVGTLRHYERGADGTWHDGLLMDLLKSDLI